jgi:hypothetical protein
MDVQILYDGEDITHQVTSYTRQQQICTGIGVATFTLTRDNNIEPQTYKEFVLYESGVKKGTYVVTDFTDSVPSGTVAFGCQDYSKRLQDYFISETTLITAPTTARSLIVRYLEEAGVSYNFNTVESGNLVNNQSTFGLSDALSTITQLLQMNGWYMYFNPDNVAQIGRFQFEAETVDGTVDDTNVIQFSTTNNDTMFRNRVVVWGMGDPMTGNWVHAEINETGLYPNEYDSRDTRSIVISNPYIPDDATAMSIAAKAIREFAKSNYEVSIDIIGPQDIVLGDQIFLDSYFQQFLGTVTTIGSNADTEGNITHIVLNQRCPRLFSYYDYGGYVYIGTEGSGVWRKHMNYDHTWTDYSTGLTNLYVTDLYVANGMLVCTTQDGSLWQRWVGASTWSRVLVSGMTPEGEEITQDNLFFVACTINSTDTTVYALANIVGAVVGLSSCYLLTKNGQVGVLEQVNYLGDYSVVGIDVDTDNSIPIITCIVGGELFPDNRNVRNTERHFNSFEFDDLSDLKQNHMNVRGHYQRTITDAIGGWWQSDQKVFWGDYVYQFNRQYIFLDKDRHSWVSITRKNLRMDQLGLQAVPPDFVTVGFDLANGLGDVDDPFIALIDENIAVVGCMQTGITIESNSPFYPYPSNIRVINFLDSTCQELPITFPGGFTLRGGGIYALPNKYLVIIGHAGLKVIGYIFDMENGELLSSPLGDIIIPPFTEDDMDDFNFGIGTISNVDGVIFGIAGGTAVLEDDIHHYSAIAKTFTFAYGYNLKYRKRINKRREFSEWEKLWFMVEDRIEISGSAIALAYPFGVDYKKQRAYFHVDIDGSDALYISYIDFENYTILSDTQTINLIVGSLDTEPYLGTVTNLETFYFTRGDDLYLPENMILPIYSGNPPGGRFSQSADSETGEVLYTIWVPLPNTENQEHYEIYAVNPLTNTQTLISKDVVVAYDQFRSTRDWHEIPFEFRSNKLSIGGDSQYVILPEVETPRNMTLPLMYTLLATASGVTTSGSWTGRSFSFSTNMLLPAKIEVSYYSPYALYGAVTIPASGIITYSGIAGSGMLFMSSTAQPGSWNINIPGLAGSGIVRDVRSFKSLTYSGYKYSTIFTQEGAVPSGVIVPSGYTAITEIEETDEGLIPGIYATFSGQVQMLETTHMYDQQYVFASISGISTSGSPRITFYQKDGGVGQFSGNFTERSTNLPQSAITVIRVDNRV